MRRNFGVFGLRVCSVRDGDVFHALVHFRGFVYLGLQCQLKHRQGLGQALSRRSFPLPLQQYVLDATPNAPPERDHPNKCGATRPPPCR